MSELADALDKIDADKIKKLTDGKTVEQIAEMFEGDNQETLNKSLIYAAHDGNKKIFDALLAKGADVNYPGELGKTALLWASANGHIEIVKVLIAKGADFNYSGLDGYTSLIIAAEKGHKEIVDALLAEGADVNHRNMTGDTALTLAAAQGKKKVVDALLANRAKGNHSSKDVDTALTLAAEKGHKEIVDALLAEGADVNHSIIKGNTALLFAAHDGHKDIVDALLAKGANVNHSNKNGNTALLCASRNGHKGIVDALLAEGADVNHSSDLGYKALDYAAYYQKKEIVDALLAEGADVNHSNSRDGSTALIRAAEKGHKEIVEALLARRANVNHRDNDGNTALDYAKNDEIRKIIQIYPRFVSLNSKEQINDKDIKFVLDHFRDLSISDQIAFIVNAQSKQLKEAAKVIFFKTHASKENVEATIKIIDEVISNSKSVDEKKCEDIYNKMVEKKLVPQPHTAYEKNINIKKIQELTTQYIEENKSQNFLKRAVRKLLHFVGVKYVGKKEAISLLAKINLQKELKEGHDKSDHDGHKKPAHTPTVGSSLSPNGGRSR